MKILLAEHRGFCYGVERAVTMALDAAGREAKAATLGPIIHNPQMVARLAEKGVGMVNDLNELENGTVIIRSHGVGPAVYREAEAKQLNVVDATCPHVRKAQQAAGELAAAGYKVVEIGRAHV